MTLVLPVLADVLATIKPMLADTSSMPMEALVGGGWLFDEKVDGIRALAAWDAPRKALTLRNRNGRDITESYPDLQQSAAGGHLPSSDSMILDGEIVAASGRFQDVQWRDKRPLAQVAAAPGKVPVIYKAFDLLHWNGQDLRHLPYSERREALWGLLRLLPTSEWDLTRLGVDTALYEEIRAAGGEGVIAKRADARYQAGRSRDWLKYKSKHTVTCIGYGYEPGKGAREEFGALLLCMIEGTEPNEMQAKPVGKVGTGFTIAQTKEMKALVDSEKLPVVEVECLGKTRDGLLRQPAYLGVRTDAVLLDARISQLDDLPTT